MTHFRSISNKTYLDDIIIYSKTLKKHKRHVRLILHRLRETDLQMNINKCEFYVQKIFFLKLLLFIEELKMNLRKVQAVVEWSTSTNLIQMQFFVDFCNFYRRFIKKLFKDCSFSDSTNSKRGDIWMKSSLSNDLWSYEETNDWSLYSSSFWSE